MILVVALLSFVFSFSILFLTRMYLAEDKLPTGDAFFHLLIIESIKKHHWKYPSSLQNVTFLYDVKPYNYLAYPPLFHYVVAFFPAKFYLLIAKIFNLVTLSVLSSITAVFAYNVTSNFALALFASFIVTFNLSTFENIVAFNSRALGVLFYSLVFYVAIIYPQNLSTTIVIAFLIMLTNLTHKFATQAVIFGLVPYCLIFDRLNFIIAIALGFLLSIIVSRGFYLNILKEHFYWLYYYSFYPDKAHITTKLRKIFSRNFWYFLIVSAIALSCIYESSSILHNHLAAKVTFWAFIPILPALIVSIPRLSFLGEEYRYVQYGVVPVAIASSLYTVNSNVYLWLLSFLCVLMSLLALLKFKKFLNDSPFLVCSEDILSYNSLKSNRISNLLVFPHVRTLEVHYFTNLPVIHPARPRFPWSSEYVEQLLKVYGVCHILKFKGHDKTFEGIKEVAKLDKILGFGNFEVYKLVENATCWLQ